jgi:hypothetical protein
MRTELSSFRNARDAQQLLLFVAFDPVSSQAAIYPARQARPSPPQLQSTRGARPARLLPSRSLPGVPARRAPAERQSFFVLSGSARAQPQSARSAPPACLVPNRNLPGAPGSPVSSPAAIYLGCQRTELLPEVHFHNANSTRLWGTKKPLRECLRRANQHFFNGSCCGVQ